MKKDVHGIKNRYKTHLTNTSSHHRAPSLVSISNCSLPTMQR